MSDLNNMKEEKNQDYKDIISSLDNFVMIKWDDDATIIPRESSHFGYYVLGQDNLTETLQVKCIQVTLYFQTPGNCILKEPNEHLIMYFCLLLYHRRH